MEDDEEPIANSTCSAPDSFSVSTEYFPSLPDSVEIFENVDFQSEVVVQDEPTDSIDGYLSSERKTVISCESADQTLSRRLSERQKQQQQVEENRIDDDVDGEEEDDDDEDDEGDEDDEDPSTSHMSLSEMQRQIFSFETDHLALKANSEYKSILKILVLLEAQRVTAVEDLNTLKIEKAKALEDPAAFVEKLGQRKTNLPERQAIPEVPEVDFSKYSISAKYISTMPQQTRATAFDMPTTSRASDTESESKASLKPNKPETYNKPWTFEEQRRLEDLLKKYPPEAVEARRWKKIADELGNRTIKQVASRVQKFFIKLTRAGLKVPGRTPHIRKSSKKVRKVQSTLKTQTYYLSTFFPQHAPSVMMDDEPVEEIPVNKDQQRPPVEQCHCCKKPVNGSGFCFRCEDCGVLFCAEGQCQQESTCFKNGHSIKLVSQSQVDDDYVIENHYLDPNYLLSRSN